jgi:hypothetical protein
MIDIKELVPEHVGKWVEYRDGTGETERGRIKSWNDRFVFVVYRCDGEWNSFKDFIGAATDPSDLTFRIDGQR